MAPAIAKEMICICQESHGLPISDDEILDDLEDFYSSWSGSIGPWSFNVVREANDLLLHHLTEDLFERFNSSLGFSRCLYCAGPIADCNCAEQAAEADRLHEEIHG